MNGHYKAVQSGNWYDAATWDGGQVPPHPIPANDVVEIPEGVTVLLQHSGLIHVQRNEGKLVVDGQLKNFDVLINSGAISIDGKFVNILGALTFNEQAGSISTTGEIRNSGVFHNEHGTVHVARGGLFDNYLWAITSNRGGTVTISGRMTNNEEVTNDGNLIIDAGGEFVNEASRSVLRNTGRIEVAGRLVNPGSSIPVQGVLVHRHGLVENANHMVIQQGGLLANSGTVLNTGDTGIQNRGTVENAGGILDNRTRVTNYGQASIRNSDGGRITNAVSSATILNRGRIENDEAAIDNMGLVRSLSGGRVQNRAMIWSRGTFALRSGSVLDNVDGTVLSFCSAKLRNNGHIANDQGRIFNYLGSVTGSGSISGNAILTLPVCIP